MRKFLLIAGLIVLALLIITSLAAAYLTEGALHPLRLQPPNSEPDPVTIRAPDGAALRAWFRSTTASPKGCVILLHGIGDTHRGVSGLADFLVPAGYSALLPDIRAHGQSGGAIATYGVLDSQDVSRWLDWLQMQPGCDRLYGQGQSLGGSILLQSLDHEKRFRAIVADSAYSSFSSIATERVSRALPHLLAVPIVFEGMAYAKLRYGVSLFDASARKALPHAKTPVLLIHGLADSRTSADNSRRLHDANPMYTQLWLVPHADHVGSYAAEPEDYRRRVIEWFTSAR
jgi:dipeptidyl aminopeptidase/acylaminoacyl peptidase